MLSTVKAEVKTKGHKLTPFTHNKSEPKLRKCSVNKIIIIDFHRKYCNEQILNLPQYFHKSFAANALKCISRWVKVI